MSAIILDDEVVHYEVLGKGRPIIFLHGWAGSWRYWIPCMQATSLAFRTYALDLWGFGDTAKKPKHYSMAAQVQLVDSFIKKMGIGRVALVGHGLGGIIALNMTFQNPHLIERVMAIGLPIGNNSHYARIASVTSPNLVERLLGRSNATSSVRGEALKADSQAIQVSLDELTDLNILELSIEMETPCLYVYGQSDPMFNPTSGEKIFELKRNTHFIVFEGSGHFPMLDEVSKFNRLLADFLNLNSGESPRQLQLKEEWKRRIR